ncbi:MAG: hypothetical protein RSD95_13035 [Clostridia bacterium]
MSEFQPIVTQYGGDIEATLITDQQAMAAGLTPSIYRGANAYLHIKFANTPTPMDADMTDAPGEYIGLCADQNQIAPTSANLYVWNRANYATEEAKRVQAETGRTAAESSRATAEEVRNSAEIGRAQAEQGRVEVESGRAMAEKDRVSVENNRRSAEEARVLAEAARSGAEQSRVSAESARVAAETQRAALGLTMIDGKLCVEVKRE